MNYEYLLDGKKEAIKITKLLNYQITELPVRPVLAVILVGNDSASKLYVSLKERKAKEIGVGFQKFLLPAGAREQKIIALIQKLNHDKKITGILLQLPLPKKFNPNKIISFIAPEKDVDGLIPPLSKGRLGGVKFNLPSPVQSATGKFSLRKEGNKIIPPRIQSILHLIKIAERKKPELIPDLGYPKSGMSLQNKKAIIFCNSLELAKPLKFLLEKNFNLKKIDILPKPYKLQPTSYNLIISVLGQKHWLKPAMIKKNAVVIDVGITRQGKKTFGDVHPDCFKKSKYISPVPGGVGPLTVAFLFKNLIKLATNN